MALSLGEGSGDEEEIDPATPLLQVGDTVPNFTCSTTDTNMMTFHDALDEKWTLVISAPKNFDPVAVSQVAQIAKMKLEFETRQMNVFMIGVDSKINLKAWKKDVLELAEQDVDFPIIVDESGYISKAFGLVRPEERDLVRNLTPTALLVLIDPELTIQLLHHYPVSTGHNIFEVLRVVDSAKLCASHPVGTPANWLTGEDVFIQPEVPVEEATVLFEKGFLEIRSWFRITPVPDEETEGETGLEGDDNSTFATISTSAVS